MCLSVARLPVSSPGRRRPCRLAAVCPHSGAAEPPPHPQSAPQAGPGLHHLNQMMGDRHEEVGNKYLDLRAPGLMQQGTRVQGIPSNVCIAGMCWSSHLGAAHSHPEPPLARQPEHRGPCFQTARHGTTLEATTLKWED